MLVILLGLLGLGRRRTLWGLKEGSKPGSHAGVGRRNLLLGGSEYLRKFSDWEEMEAVVG